MPDVRHLFHRLMPVLPVALLVASHAPAQRLFTPGAGLTSFPGFVGPGPNGKRECGPGVGWGYYGVTGGPTTAFVDQRVGVWNWGWGGRPDHAAGTWARHLGRYGQPVPNYVPLPAVGGSDAREHFMTPPAFGYGLTSLGYRSASPRLATPSVSVHPTTALPAPTTAGCARLEVRLPHPAAEVWVNDAKTTSTGAERSFESPELAAGKEYRYAVTARWTAAGEPKAASREVLVQAGSTVLVDFQQPK